MTKFITLSRNKVAILLLVIIGCYALRTPINVKRTVSRLRSTAEQNPNDAIEELISCNELRNVFTLLQRNPTLVPSPEQSTLLLNNLNIFAQVTKGGEVAKFYSRLQKGGKAIPSFGSMVADGPLSEINLPKFEVLMTVDPAFLQAVSEMKQSTYESLLIPNELGVMPSTSRSSLEIRVKLQIALLFGFLDYGYQLMMTGDSHVSLVNVALTFAIASGLAIIESPPFLNGEIGRRIGWVKSSIAQMLSADEKKTQYRSNAATFLVSYLLGCPIQDIDLNPNSPLARMKFRYPDAPRIDLRDPAMAILEQRGQIDIVGLKRQASIHLAASALKAIEGTGTPKIADYCKILLAALAQRGANPMFSTIPHEEFPNRLLPTLARWGFVEAAMIIREYHTVIDALVEVFEIGGGVGDAIAVIEKTIGASTDSALIARRNRRIQLENEILLKDYSTFNAIEAIGNAKAVATPTQTVDLEPIELIPGTSRIYTRNELVLPSNPSPTQVKNLAREIMNNKLQADKMQYGKVTEQTKKAITDLYEQITEALKLYENTEKAKTGIERDFESTIPNANVPDTLRDSQAYMRTMMAAEEKEGLLHQVGLSQEKLKIVKQLPSFMQNLDIIGETLIQFNKLSEAYWNNFYNIEALWVFRGRVYFDRFTGLAATSAIDSIWDATGLTTRILKADLKADTGISSAGKNLGGGKLNKDTVKELKELVSRIESVPSGESVPDGSSGGASKETSAAAREEVKGIKMIPVGSDNFALMSRDAVDRNHMQRRNALIAARTLPLLTDLLPPRESAAPEENASPADDDLILAEDGDVVITLSLPRLMIMGNLGSSYRNLEESIEKLDANDALKSERMKELAKKLKV